MQHTITREKGQAESMRLPYHPHQRIDHYEILERLPDSQGNQVYLAQDWLHYRQVVLTIPNDAQVGGKRVFERFQQAIQAHTALSHPAFQQMLVHRAQDQESYLVLPEPDGMTLREWMHQADRLKLPTSEIVGLITAVGEAVSMLHQQGLVHGDLKPEHIVIRPTGAPTLTGLGLAQPLGKQRRQWGQIGFPVGTPNYLAPERWWGHPGSVQADIYALGVILYELLCGHPPFPSVTSYTLLVPQLAFDPPSLRQFRPDVSLQLAAVVMRAIRRDSRKRYTSMPELLTDLAHLDQIAPLDEQPDPPLFGGRYRLVLFLLLLTLVVLIGLIAFGLLAQLLHTSMH